MRKTNLWFVAAALAGCTTEPSFQTSDELLKRNNGFLPNGTMIPNEHGHSTTISTLGSIDLNNEFFQDLGTNGRRCISCHLPTAGWSVTPEQMQDTFDKTDGGITDDDFGLGAVFRTNDGANSPNADVSTLEARREAYSMLLTKGLIRVGIGMPANAEFTIESIDDPYGYASPAELSLFRRPLPSTNLKFLSAVMWDGRETFAGKSIHFDLSDQANGATQGHAQGAAITDAQATSIANFELALYTAQESDQSVGALDQGGARGGAQGVIDQEFWLGINDTFAADFDRNAMTLYDAWSNGNKSRSAIARGQKIFNTRTFNLRAVGGLNDDLGLDMIGGATCTTCHNTPNGGNHSVSVPLDIGLVAKARRTPDLPLYTLRCTATGQVFLVTDPGRALITGKCKDIGRFKGPVLRGLAARPPYFHNGSAETLADVVEFYNDRFDIGLNKQEKADLAAFLATL